MRCTVAADEMQKNHLGLNKQHYSLCDWNTGLRSTYMQKILNNLKMVTSHQNIEGAAQSDFRISSVVAVHVSLCKLWACCMHCK